MCTVLLPPGVYPIEVKYIISYEELTQKARASTVLDTRSV